MCAQTHADHHPAPRRAVRPGPAGSGTERRTVTSVIEEALRAALAERERAADVQPYRVDVIPGVGLQPGVDLDDNAALAELMDGA